MIELERITFNQSRIKTFNRCPKSYEYKYVQLLQSKQRARPLYTGSWIHKALETYYAQSDWKIDRKSVV